MWNASPTTQRKISSHSRRLYSISIFVLTHKRFLSQQNICMLCRYRSSPYFNQLPRRRSVPLCNPARSATTGGYRFITLRRVDGKRCGT